ncbi:MAG TPA: DUF4157 domain-containing protein, partial [Rubrivivax sp.]|nr:DUF4157 domain-containing protein [Rubrivivax sp.]
MMSATMVDVHGLSFGAADRGLPLPGPLLDCMERLFGADFGDVRVHLSQLPRSLGRRVIVHGSDLYVDPDSYAPEGAEGWRLIGHGLAHVLHSLRGWPLAPEGVGVRVLDDPLLELEAEQMAELAWRAFHAGLPATPP